LRKYRSYREVERSVGGISLDRRITGILESGLACRSIGQKASPSTRGICQSVTTVSGARLFACANASHPSSAVVTWLVGLKQEPHCLDALGLVVH